jgi:sulfur-oxidizing protein SoxB
MREIVLVQMNDLHGYLESHTEWFWTSSGFVYRKAGGIARIKTIVDEIRAEHGQVLFTDNGDTFHGTRAVVETEGSCLVPILNRLGISAMTGHWDFAYGPDHLKKLVDQLDYPFLAANVYDREDGTLVFPPCRRVHIGAIRIGIIGLACNIVDKTMPAHFSEGIRFTDGTEELPRYIAQLREREHVDVVVLLSHLGLPQDVDLLERTPGVDVCLSSHTHNRLVAPLQIGRTVLIQSGCHGSFLGKLRLKLDVDGVSVLEHRLISVDESVSEEPGVRDLVQAALAPYRIEQGSIVGKTSCPLNRATMLESSADTMLLEAMLQATKADVAFANGWRYGAPIEAGSVTIEDLYNLAPMNPEITVVDLSGEEIARMIEENLERTFSREPFGQMGGYVKRCAGMKTYFKVENPKGSRVQAIFIGEAPLERARIYKAAYITVQAIPDHFGTKRTPTGIRLIEACARMFADPYVAAAPGSFVEV